MSETQYHPKFLLKKNNCGIADAASVRPHVSFWALFSCNHCRRFLLEIMYWWKSAKCSAVSDNLGTVLRLPQGGRCVPPLLYIVRRGAIRQVTNLGGSIVLNCGALQINSFPLFTSQCAHAGFIGHAAGAFDLLESHLLVISFVERKKGRSMF